MTFKKMHTLALLLGLFAAGLLNAQTRYLHPMFNKVDVTFGQTYGVNATVLYFGQLNQAIPEALKMDVYTPNGDTDKNRPIVLFLHTGNFLPFVNPATGELGANGSCGGTRNDSTCVEICTRLAKMGYVAASMSYRLGWNPLAGTDVERRFGIINAAYRGIQDVRTCIRYFKKSVKESANPWGVDTTRIVVFGQGTGGYLSLNVGALDNYLKIPTASEGKFLYDPDGAGPTPIIPMILEHLNGNINGTNWGIRTNTGLPTGTPIDTFCMPNHVGYTSNFQLAVNLGGALADTSWIDPGQPPLISFHVPNDNFAPYVEGLVNVPGTNPPLQVVKVQGSYLAQKLNEEYGNNTSFIGKPILDLGTEQDKAFAGSPAGQKTPYEGLYPMLVTANPNAPSFPSTTAPWEWTSFVPTPPLTCNSVKSTASASIDTIMRFYTPRACFALGLQPCIDKIVGAKEPLLENIELTAAPNPASSVITLTSPDDRLMQSVQVFDRTGRMVRDVNGLNSNTFVFERQELIAGLYVVKASFKEGFVTKIVVFE